MIRFLARVTCSLVCLLVAAPVAVQAVAAATLVIPPGFAEVCATGSSQSFPFATAPPFNYPYRHQQVYEASGFAPAMVGVGEVMRISELRFRIDEDQGGREPLMHNDITVNLSTTELGVNELTTGSTEALDSNVGPDAQLGFSGTLNWDACGTPDTCPIRVCGAGGDFSVTPFDQVVVLTNPFDYDPAAGNLLVEVFSNDPTPPDQLFDAITGGFMPGTSRVREVILKLDGLHSFPGLDPQEIGLVTQFAYTVPEAGATAGAAVALLGLYSLRRRRS